MKVQVISKEFIKPSVPTPPHLRNFKLSLLDQIQPPYYVPVVLFYPASADHHSNNITAEQTRKSESLKTTLSETLTHFYPVAGRVRDDVLIDCTNNEGVDYIEARIDGAMSDFMSVDVVHQLHPSHIMLDDVAKEAQLAIQVNLFDCGGIAISISTSHKIIDGCTAITFYRCWAAITRGAPKQEILYPTFDSADIFPALPPQVQVSSLDSDDSVQGENVVTKVFVFTAPSIAALRARISDSRSSSAVSRHPSRAEALSALIWKSFIKTSRVKAARGHTGEESTKPVIRSVANYAVNLRTKLNPPLSQVSFGNIIMDATAESTTTTDHDDTAPGFGEALDGLISQLRLGISRINGEYVRKLQQGDVEFLKSLDEASHHSNGQENVQICWLNSLCRFPFYETDFGWGKPSWFALNTKAEYKNTLYLLDTKCGDGIEAWVSLEEEDMAIFEEDEDLLQYVKAIN